MVFAPRVTASRKLSFVLPWLFILAVGALSLVPAKWQRAPKVEAPGATDDPFWREIGEGRHRAEALYTIDGDTFVARVRLVSGQNVTARVRLRGIDAPEMQAACAEEERLAARARAALRARLREGGIVLFNAGPDRYGRIVADVATRRTADLSRALVDSGHGRPYGGGRRDGWC